MILFNFYVTKSIKLSVIFVCLFFTKILGYFMLFTRDISERFSVNRDREI